MYLNEIHLYVFILSIFTKLHTLFRYFFSFYSQRGWFLRTFSGIVLVCSKTFIICLFVLENITARNTKTEKSEIVSYFVFLGEQENILNTSGGDFVVIFLLPIVTSRLSNPYFAKSITFKKVKPGKRRPWLVEKVGYFFISIFHLTVSLE